MGVELLSKAITALTEDTRNNFNPSEMATRTNLLDNVDHLKR